VKGEIAIETDASDLARRGAELFLAAAKASVRRRGRFVAAISGGSTPRAMHRLLAQIPYISDVPWQKTHLFWVDERMVPPEDPESNFGTAKTDFLSAIPLPPQNLHPMPVTISPEAGTARYEAELKAYFQSGLPIFDLIFLGIGTDGHTASLFPGQLLTDDSKQWVVSVKGGQSHVPRLSLTFHVLNHARQVIFLVSGKKKANVIKTLFEDTRQTLPAGRVHPVSGKLLWLLDRDAASFLSQ
jgi:6-phosphogluconolactonase